ncbi:GGDEF domain-containing phosphodiesterase [Cohnella ginsengisoli]|uniref:GGDEF domain-containing phosphodiesterase n=1 Tax=Cohnella ginsengisoli TaxID=425004 RepID=A0A9X4QQ75_9BACL|nr:EAL domain-containing protein [Cohnella ginsengisoli]MDG0795109.1 GGDEF domain-containing phosphodiesterase [Cohnella ginsengisoli]
MYADIAMYNAKQEGGNCYRFYDSAQDGANASKLNIENDLRKALDKGEFIIHYQPKVDLCSGEITGLEALVRWQHPERGLVPPLEFIPVAEETGLIVPLGKWVLEEACRQMKQWHERGYAKLGIAVNFSSRQFRDKNMVSHVARTLQLSGLDPECLEIELTESIMQNVKESLVILSELKQLGVHISIDDFGTGYSSLSYLKHLPIDTLKVDKSFVDDIALSPKDEAIIRTIVDMGNHLQLNIVAEGVENKQQAQALMACRCKIGQGYYFSKPLPHNEVELLFRNVYLNSDE